MVAKALSPRGSACSFAGLQRAQVSRGPAGVSGSMLLPWSK